MASIVAAAIALAKQEGYFREHSSDHQPVKDSDEDYKPSGQYHHDYDHQRSKNAGHNSYKPAPTLHRALTFWRNLNAEFPQPTTHRFVHGSIQPERTHPQEPHQQRSALRLANSRLRLTAGGRLPSAESGIGPCAPSRTASSRPVRRTPDSPRLPASSPSRCASHPAT